MSIPATIPSKPSAVQFESPPQATNARTHFFFQAGSRGCDGMVGVGEDQCKMIKVEGLLRMIKVEVDFQWSQCMSTLQ
ncbi:hypothetical protein CROQUDRAFT_661213 [Cronartium quercuum f. sp. fusiforme G11]|uniref:Uncharacterized protein n=1 Tax=Cronartium quercuum f. sp. fusiforme G11 TaxID=708437 RepID=A0A9P6NGW6_9BASI|nr:hypothetical protein CROQUDRAFT_661213 [Cronartium quercuum f. sp. fusiforme G11]